MTRRSTATAIAALFVVGIALTTMPSVSAATHDNNAGTIKVHNNATADPETRNEPHVACSFYVEGFNMNDPSGSLVFYSWPPTGDKSVVTPSGDSLTWTADSGNSHGNYHFLKGAYHLSSGHYRVEAYTDDGTPSGHHHFAKAKMFWVDGCAPTTGGTPPPVVTPPTGVTPPTDVTPPTGSTPPPGDSCSESMPASECAKVPFFPTAGSAILGVLGAVGSIGAIILRRK